MRTAFAIKLPVLAAAMAASAELAPVLAAPGDAAPPAARFEQVSQFFEMKSRAASWPARWC